MNKENIELNKLDYCPGCNKDLKGWRNVSKSVHRGMCIEFQYSIGNDIKYREQARRSKIVKAFMKNGRCSLSGKNRLKNDQGKDIIAKRSVDVRLKIGKHNFSRENLPEDWKPLHKYSHDLIYDSIHMRSSWEVKFASQLDQMGIDWDYESHIFKYISTDGLEHRYLPDFLYSFIWLCRN